MVSILGKRQCTPIEVRFLLVDAEVRYWFCFCFFLLKIVITVMTVQGNAT